MRHKLKFTFTFNKEYHVDSRQHTLLEWPHLSGPNMIEYGVLSLNWKWKNKTRSIWVGWTCPPPPSPNLFQVVRYRQQFHIRPTTVQCFLKVDLIPEQQRTKDIIQQVNPLNTILWDVNSLAFHLLPHKIKTKSDVLDHSESTESTQANALTSKHIIHFPVKGYKLEQCSVHRRWNENNIYRLVHTHHTYWRRNLHIHRRWNENNIYRLYPTTPTDAAIYMYEGTL